MILDLSIIERGLVKDNLQKSQEFMRELFFPPTLCHNKCQTAFGIGQNSARRRSVTSAKQTCAAGDRNDSRKQTWSSFKLSYLAVWISPCAMRHRLLRSLHIQGADSVSGNCACTPCLGMSVRLLQTCGSLLRCFDCPVCVQIAFICWLWKTRNTSLGEMLWQRYALKDPQCVCVLVFLVSLKEQVHWSLSVYVPSNM